MIRHRAVESQHSSTQEEHRERSPALSTGAVNSVQLHGFDLICFMLMKIRTWHRDRYSAPATPVLSHVHLTFLCCLICFHLITDKSMNPK